MQVGACTNRWDLVDSEGLSLAREVNLNIAHFRNQMCWILKVQYIAAVWLML
uniref:Uncharacterized protein n=1 Tax=Arion vulgaris TaxID=1028688 RepID=A0A0B6XZ65_9EUPU